MLSIVLLQDFFKCCWLFSGILLSARPSPFWNQSNRNFWVLWFAGSIKFSFYYCSSQLLVQFWTKPSSRDLAIPTHCPGPWGFLDPGLIEDILALGLWGCVVAVCYHVLTLYSSTFIYIVFMRGQGKIHFLEYYIIAIFWPSEIASDLLKV